ncbi:MAG: type IV pilin N-terminal domain-containing protein [Thermoplasmata archaeon]|nr:type IV pilin N-terminal domain-containing protein [Thermoplasmata archaeon]
MIAITIVLAGVVMAFVMGMIPNITKTNKFVAVTMQQPDGTHISLTNMGGQDVGSLVSVNVTGDLKIIPAVKLGASVGSTNTYELSAGAGQKHIIAVGLFKDGSEQVLIDTQATRTAP